MICPPGWAGSRNFKEGGLSLGMRIAQVAPLYESVPPKYYGGTERVVSYSHRGTGATGPRSDALCERRFGDECAAGGGVPEVACRVRTSNAGHCLFAGIATEERARRVASTLTDETSFSGWGIRTVASSEARYNPMSYHNGSIWPHDNSLIAAGFARYELKGSVAMVLAGMMDASIFFDLHRLPELFCGFPRRPGEAATLYPVACAPQAWASAAVFLLLQACLGLDVFAPERRLVFSKPFLPQFLPQVSIRDLKVGDASVDLLLTRHNEEDVGVNVLRRKGNLDVVVLK